MKRTKKLLPCSFLPNRLLVLAFGLVSCGGRTLTAPDAAPADARQHHEAARPIPDACILPAGYCQEQRDCPVGFDCQGGYACKGLAYYQCGCPELVPCLICSSVVGKCLPEDNSCTDLDSQYRQEVSQAKKCCPQCDVIQCLTKVPSQLRCPCDTYINTQETQKMKALRQQWLTKDCASREGAPCIPCAELFGGDCDVTSAMCVDTLAD